MNTGLFKAQSEKKLVVLTGGGSAGHVMCHLAIIDDLIKANLDIVYYGTLGIEYTLIKRYFPDLKFVKIKSGKIRRYFSFYTIKDFFFLAVGLVQCIIGMLGQRPKLVVSRGSYVSVPVTIAAWILRVPVIVHEADRSLSLSLKLSALFSRRILYTFSDTIGYLSRYQSKSYLTGLPLRFFMLKGDGSIGYKLCKFTLYSDHSAVKPQLPVLLIMGGSQGSAMINKIISKNLTKLLTMFRVIYLCGTSNQALGFQKSDAGNQISEGGISYIPNQLVCFSYLDDDLRHIYQIVDFAISRGGANSIFELINLSIPTLYIPLQRGSRGEQMDNVSWVCSLELSMMVKEHSLINGDGDLINCLKDLQKNSDLFKGAMQAYLDKSQNPNKLVMNHIKAFL